MERITPIDLERAKLDKSFRGYAPAQVQALLQQAAKEMAELRSEIERLRSEQTSLTRELDNHRAQENTLKEALILAQRTADETRAAAHKEGDLIVEQARQKSAEVEAQMHTKINDLRWELERLRLDKQKFVGTYRAMLEGQLRDIAETGGLSVVEGDLPTHAIVETAASAHVGDA